MPFSMMSRVEGVVSPLIGETAPAVHTSHFRIVTGSDASVRRTHDSAPAADACCGNESRCTITGAW